MKTVYYQIQHRRIATSPWLQPKGKISPVKDKLRERDWGTSGKDSWGKAIDPHIGSGLDYRARNPKAHEELYQVGCRTGHEGWLTKRYALNALRLSRRLDAKGVFDSYDGYRNHCQAVRHEFRLVKITYYKRTEIIPTYEEELV